MENLQCIALYTSSTCIPDGLWYHRMGCSSAEAHSCTHRCLLQVAYALTLGAGLRPPHASVGDTASHADNDADRATRTSSLPEAMPEARHEHTESDAEQVGPFRVQHGRGQIHGYGQAVIQLEFWPVGTGERQLDGSISLTALADNAPALDAIPIHLQVRCDRV